MNDKINKIEANYGLELGRKDDKYNQFQLKQNDSMSVNSECSDKQF